MKYIVIPTNDGAQRAVKKVIDCIDGRLAISDNEKAEVVAFLLAHRHLDSIHLPSHPKLTTALVDAQVVGRTKGSTHFFVRSTFRDLSGLTFATSDDATIRAYPVTKSGLWCRSRAAAEGLLWTDVAGLGYGAAYYFGIVDTASSVAAFRDGAAPSVSFQHCIYSKRDEGAATDLVNLFLEQAFLQGIAVAPIFPEGEMASFAVEQPDRALHCLNATTTKFLNRAGPRFAVVTRDRYGRAAHSYGSFI